MHHRDWGYERGRQNRFIQDKRYRVPMIPPRAVPALSLGTPSSSGTAVCHPIQAGPENRPHRTTPNKTSDWRSGMRDQRSMNRSHWTGITCLGAFFVFVNVSTATLWAQATGTNTAPATPAVDSQNANARNLPRSIPLNLRQFEIPFTIDATGNQPVEVQLYVSRNQGAQWELFASQPASGKNFLFTTQQDGVYWFATRTVDGTGKSDPSGTIHPQLIVNIDTENPVAEINAELTNEGRILVSLACTDQSPSVDSLRIDYSIDQSRQWNAVNDVSGRTDPVDQNRFYASADFMPFDSWQQISVRALVGDAAGNKTIVTTSVDKPRVAASDFRLATNKSNPNMDAVATPAGQLPVAVPPAGSMQLNSPMAVPQFAVSSGATPAITPAPTPLNIASGGPELSAPLPPGEPPLPEPAATPTPTPQQRPKTAAAAMRPLGDGDSTPTDWRQSAARVSPNAVESAEQTQPVNPTNPPVPNAGTIDNSVGEPVGDGLSAAGVQIRYSNSRKFSLDYEIESAGLAGVSDVELWGSRDRGLTWKRWGSDPDRESPFDIETNNDGAYGFRIVVVANNGLATPRPIENDLPDIFVVVDTEAPAIRITGAAYGEGNQTGALVMRYQCTDLNLTQRPITLSFGPSLSGPWSTIAAGLENEGAYVWPADPNLPRQIYLRIDALDLAGNLGTYILDTPIDIQGLAPRARIRGFNPVTGSAGGTRPVAGNTGQAKESGRPQTATQPQARFK